METEENFKLNKDEIACLKGVFDNEIGQYHYEYRDYQNLIKIIKDYAVEILNWAIICEHLVTRGLVAVMPSWHQKDNPLAGNYRITLNGFKALSQAINGLENSLYS